MKSGSNVEKILKAGHFALPESWAHPVAATLTRYVKKRGR